MEKTESAVATLQRPADETVWRRYALYLAHAVSQRFQGGTVQMGGGFAGLHSLYCDFGIKQRFGRDDGEWIQNRIRELIEESPAIESRVMTERTARYLFARQPYTLDAIAAMVAAKQDIVVYSLDGFSYLSCGPIADSAAHIDPSWVTLIARTPVVSGSDGKQKLPLQRLHVLCFTSREELEAYESLRADVEQHTGVEVVILAQADRHVAYAQQVADSCSALQLAVDVQFGDTVRGTPLYTLVITDLELAGQQVGVVEGSGTEGCRMPFEHFAALARHLVAAKR